ncbi:phospholipid carrier-dependent glycosyltransferase [Haloglomus halophilum]|uniref:phospholipid carrier-dependent glycosyltransferase n=1 Tax=Haloglomus halophilum TaxID=2962672 RepID=UPI0020C9BF1D|nr:phospholipid carrier-dependent glycosyltransferase [Haloglomus halophilum]
MFITLFGVGMFLLITYSNTDSRYILLLIISGAVLWRVYLFTFPASLIGIDPDWFAWQVFRVSNTGTIEPILSHFYGRAPLFIVFSSMFNHVGEVGVSWSLIIYPFILGIGFPIFVYSIISQLWGNRNHALMGASLIAVEPTSIAWGIYPIAQSLATFFFVASILSVMSLYDHNKSRYYLVFITFVLAMTLTHKLPILYLVLFFGFILILIMTYSVLSYFDIRLESERVVQGTNIIRTIQLAIFTSVILIVQFGIITVFLASILPIGTSKPPAISPVVETKWVVNPISEYSSIYHWFWKLEYHLIFFPAAALGGALTLLGHTSDRIDMRTTCVLAAAGITTFLFSVSFALPELLPGGNSRWEFFAAPFAVVLIIGLYRGVTSKTKKSILIFILLIMVISQVFSGIAIKEGPGTQRYYLTEPEVSAKAFSNTYVQQPVSTDSYLAKERIPSQIDYQTSNQYRNYNSNLFNRNIDADSFKYLLYRSDQEIYRGEHSSWRLRYNPQPEIEANKRIFKVYTNRNTILYH